MCKHPQFSRRRSYLNVNFHIIRQWNSKTKMFYHDKNMCLSLVVSKWSKINHYYLSLWCPSVLKSINVSCFRFEWWNNFYVCTFVVEHVPNFGIATHVRWSAKREIIFKTTSLFIILKYSRWLTVQTLSLRLSPLYTIFRSSV